MGVFFSPSAAWQTSVAKPDESRSSQRWGRHYFAIVTWMVAIHIKSHCRIHKYRRNYSTSRVGLRESINNTTPSLLDSNSVKSECSRPTRQYAAYAKRGSGKKNMSPVQCDCACTSIVYCAVYNLCGLVSCKANEPSSSNQAKWAMLFAMYVCVQHAVPCSIIRCWTTAAARPSLKSFANNLGG